MSQKDVMTLDLELVLDVATDEVVVALIKSRDGEEEAAIRGALAKLLTHLGVIESSGRVSITVAVSEEEPR